MALLPFLTSVLATQEIIREEGQKARVEQELVVGYTDSLLQSPLTPNPGFTLLTALIAQSVAKTRRLLQETTLNCLILDSGSDVVAAHEANLTDASLVSA